MATCIVAAKRVKRCEYKGCTKTDKDCVIKNHSCPDHHKEMKQKGNDYRRANQAKHRALKRNEFSFNVSSLAKSTEFMKYDSFQGNVVKTGAIGKGKLMVMTELSTSPYLALKKHGVAFIENVVTIDDDAHVKFMEYVDSVSNQFERIFTTLTPTSNPKFIATGNPNRWVMAVVGESEDFYGWNNIKEQLSEVMNNFKLPIPIRNKGLENEIEMHFNVLKTDPGVDQPQ